MENPIEGMTKPMTEPLVDTKLDLLDLFIGFGVKDGINYGMDNVLNTAAARTGIPVNHPLLTGAVKVTTAYALTKTKKSKHGLINRGKTGAEIAAGIGGMEDFRDYAVYKVNQFRQPKETATENIISEW